MKKTLLLFFFVLATMAAQAAKEPLLGSMAWNTASPYNKLCPYVENTYYTGKAHVGSVAVAMGQVMYYYKHPTTGTGSISYLDEDGSEQQVTVDFGATTYQWDKMLPSLSDDSNADAINAVATLLFHAGASVESAWGQATRADFPDVAPAMIRYFGYDASARYLLRSYYTKDEWENIIRNEIDNGRPVIYYSTIKDGSSRQAMVIDGYDDEGRFHVNWGWGGEYDGYYELSNLDYERDADYHSDATNYSYNQQMVVGIKPAEGEQHKSLVFSCDYLTITDSLVARADSFLLTGNYVYSNTFDSTAVYLDFIVEDNTGKQVYATTSDVYKAWPYNKGRASVKRYATLPANLPAGHYRAYLAARFPESDTYEKVAVKTGNSQYINLDVTDSNIKLSYGGEPSLRIAYYELNPDPLVADGLAEINFIVTNEGEEFDGYLYWKMKDGNGNEAGGDTHHEVIKKGETRKLTYKQYIHLPAGEGYRLQLKRSVGDVYTPDVVVAPDTIINIKAAAAKAELCLYDSLYMDSTYREGYYYLEVPKNHVVVYAPIRNSGNADYDGTIEVYATDMLMNSWTIASQELHIPAQADTVVTFTGAMDDGTVGGWYFTEIRNMADVDGEGHGWLEPSDYSTIFFTLGDEVDGIRTIYQTAAPRIVAVGNLLKVVNADKVNRIDIYNACGSMVGSSKNSHAAQLPAQAGIYLVKVSTPTATFTQKIIKR